ncbi:MAG: helix-turn-helix domain-containing protein [Nisaea sp.]|uniref:helix-turn-helix domain-containing protein n=1 Tax=Nisaea sp. TaxID=2024842 RepID=UPI001B118C5E|nr:helix-turn-helix domain-containing protein [Nisaea sp.]MBO6560795.1 helix-turn-helix domain-containing protein [Nisaea sp.]
MAEAGPDHERYVLGMPSDHVGLLNCERIADRRHIHVWTVEPHYHDGLAQLFLFAGGRVTGRIDGERRTIEAPALLWMPALCRHGFDYEPGMLGWVITIPSADVTRLAGGQARLLDRVRQPQVISGPAHSERLKEAEQLVRRIELEHGRNGEEQNMVLEALFSLLLVCLCRTDPTPSAPAPGPRDRQHDLVRRFRELVEGNFRTVRSVAGFAAMLAITPTHLTRTVKAVTGQTAGAIIQDRILLEAKRRLVFSDQPVAEIAYDLDFSSPSYFSRFFTARAGAAPLVYRQQARRAEAS